MARAQHGIRADRHGLVGEQEIGDDDRGRREIVVNSIGLEDKQAVYPAKQQLATGPLKCGRALEHVARQPILLVVIVDRCGLGIEARQPVVGAKPQQPTAVLQEWRRWRRWAGRRRGRSG